jgi:hypothetical protein
MQLRIRLDRGVVFERKKGKNRRLASACAALLVPACLMAGTLAIWRLAADLGIASRFPITAGWFAHWHAWSALAAGGAFVAYHLNRYGRGS